MNAVIDWTYLPWEQQDTAGKICWACLLVGVFVLLTTQIIRRSSLGYDIHEAPFVSLECTLLALAINVAIYALFFWYVAAVISTGFSLAFYWSARGMQNKIYYEEKDCKWGLCPQLRNIRGEMFSDLSVEEQLDYKKTVDASFKKLNPLWYFPLTVLLPFGIILLLMLCGLDYTFVPHAL